MKNVRTLGVILGAVAVLIAAFAIRGAMHSAALARQDTAIATQLASQGVTGFGSPDVSQNEVPFIAQPGCTVDLHLVRGTTITLDIPYLDATGRLIGATDTVTNAATAQAVRANLVATLKANPKNEVCK